MLAAEHDPKFAKKVGIPQSVAADFIREDQKDGKPIKRRDRLYPHPRSKNG